jgi:hypothetical protein
MSKSSTIIAEADLPNPHPGEILSESPANSPPSGSAPLDGSMGPGGESCEEPAKSADVIPAKAGIQFQAAGSALKSNWIPAFAGMTPVDLAWSLQMPPTAR